MIRDVLMMFALASSGSVEVMPLDGFTTPFDIVLNRGPAGQFSSDGCMQLEVGLDSEGGVRHARIVHSSKYYPIDLAVLSELKAYHFDAAGLPDREAWRVFFSWSKDGRERRLSNQCSITG